MLVGLMYMYQHVCEVWFYPEQVEVLLLVT